MTVTLHHQGQEQRPLLVLDSFWSDPELLREDAAALRLTPIGPHYPGLRAPVPPRLAEAMRAKVAPLLATHFGLERAPAVSEAYYSLVTTPPGALAPIQRLPHFDGVEPRRIARVAIWFWRFWLSRVASLCAGWRRSTRRSSDRFPPAAT